MRRKYLSLAREVLRKGCDKGLLEALTLLKASFPQKSESWFLRALARYLAGIRKVSYNHWLVPGLPELRDTRPWYNVWLRDGTYRCDCYARLYGKTREKSVCTHVAAVMLARRYERITKWM